MPRFVRVVEIVDGDPDELRRRAAGLPDRVSVTVVPTAAGVQVTLTTAYHRLPGSRFLAIRALKRLLPVVLKG